jgi:Erv1 / Alr family/Thioredoxin
MLFLTSGHLHLFFNPIAQQCQHFRKHYVEFAEQVTVIMKQLKGPDVKFYAISCTANKPLCKKQGIQGYPKIRLFAAGAHGNATAEAQYWKLHPVDILHQLGVQTSGSLDMFIGASAADDQGKDETHSHQLRTKQTPSAREYWLRKDKKLIFDDAYLSFDFNLRNGVFVTADPLRNETKAALFNWLTLLKRCTPIVWQIHGVINDILDDFDHATGSEDALMKIVDKYPPPTKQWSDSCTRGVGGMGYSCGLWQLFHIVSVGLVEYNLMISSEDDATIDELQVSTVHAAETLRNFIEHFFACHECRMSFLAAYDACALDRCSRLDDREFSLEQWMQFPVWLFETHNAVNQRLLLELAQREHRVASAEEVASRNWPSDRLCPRCWLDGGGWNETAVYLFLRTQYWVEDFVSSEYRNEIGEDRSDRTHMNAHEDAFHMTSRLLLIVQLLLPLIIVGLLATYYAKKRAQRRKSGHHKKVDIEQC